jgi:hypothetical protein
MARSPHAGFSVAEAVIAVITLGLVGAIFIARRSDDRSSAAVTDMRLNLRNVQSAEAAYYLDHGSAFAPSARDLGVLYSPTPEVTVIISGVTATHWHTTATHQSSDVRCEIDVTVASRGDVDPACR